MPTSSDEGRSNGARARASLSVLKGLLHFIVLPIGTTVRIFKMHFYFSNEIAEKENALTESVSYHVAGVFLLIILSNLVGGRLSVHLLPEFPHSEEVEAILYALGAVLNGVCGYLAVCVLKRRFVPAAKTIAAYTYWFGFFEISVLPVVVLMDKGKIDPESWIESLIVFASGVGAIVEFAFLVKWIADLNDIGLMRAFISFWLAMVSFNIVFRPLFFVLNLILRRWHFFINPYVD